MTLAIPTEPVAAPPSIPRRGRGRSQLLVALAFLLPWLIGLAVLHLRPDVLLRSTSRSPSYDLLSPPEWIGLGNYEPMFTADPRYWHSVRVTLIFALVFVPLAAAALVLLALLLNRALRGLIALPGLFYLPSLLGGSVALAVVWATCSTARRRWSTPLLGSVRHRGRRPGSATRTGRSAALMLLAIWRRSARTMIIFLAGLQQVPHELYEAAEVDGAGTRGGGSSGHAADADPA